MDISEKDETRFCSYVEVGDEDECWFWQGATTYSGHGVIGIDGRTVGAHRVSYNLIKGPIEQGNVVMHTCDVPGCVNPHHLQQGTQQDNMVDKVTKGRWKGGRSANGGRGLTDEQVREIRRLYASGVKQKDLVVMFGVTQPAISQIVNRKSHKHVT